MVDPVPSPREPRASAEVRGAAAVATTFSGRARVAQAALVHGSVGPRLGRAAGRPRVVFKFTIAGEKVVAIDLIAGDEELRTLDLVML